MMDIKIIVATHKKYDMPRDNMYIPIHVGKKGKEEIGFIGDDIGDNISSQNDFFNELTGLYWAWKNLDADYIGLVHYRRYFSKKTILKYFRLCDKFCTIADYDTVKNSIEKYGIVLPSKRKYYIETIESHYVHLPYTVNDDLYILKNIIREKTPQYYDSFEKVMNRNWAHMFNMFIMRRDFFNEYCEWAFPILFELDKLVNHEGRTKIQDRLYVSEFMVDTWIETNNYKYSELAVTFMENEHKLKKAFNLLKRKIRYEC